MAVKDKQCNETLIAEKLRNEIKELNEVFYNWTYYDTEGLFYTIREKQAALMELELSIRKSQYSNL